jgi:hypothetical protein
MRAKHLLRVIPVLAIALLAHRALAWDDMGHKTIALIAWGDLSPAVRSQITTLLRLHPQYASRIQTKGDTGEESPILDFMAAAIWADVIRTSKPEDQPFNHASWHTTVVPFITGSLEQRPTPAPTDWKPGDVADNVVQGLKKCEAEFLAPNAPDQQKAVALAWIVHMTGDIHQPLHTTSWYNEEHPTGEGDKRGNYTFVNTGSSKITLHALGRRSGQLPEPGSDAPTRRAAHEGLSARRVCGPTEGHGFHALGPGGR